MTATVVPPALAGPALVAKVAAERRRRARRRTGVTLALVAAIVVVWALSLMIGRTFYGPGTVLDVLLGRDADGATFAVGRLRLPRATLGLLAGACFGLAGVTFQTMLRNPLASPDIIGISSGASVAATFAIVVLGLDGAQVSLFAIVAGLGVALLIYVLSVKDGVAGTRLVLVGIGVTAMLEAVTTYLLQRASEWDVNEAMRWLTGSLNGSRWSEVVPVAVALAVLGPVLAALARDLETLRLGDDAASALGTRVGRTRLGVVVAAVGLIGFATAATGPIAFVAFLAGPIAARLVGPNGSLLLPAALTGSLLVLLADLVGQHGVGTRFPVGVVTGVLGAPFLVYLIIRSHRAGGSI
ncbi:iron complex transport system permease protein [Flavimobilis soli]|uniref:Iron complex transport system permease protein n=1 Tax=Flavimobilis soli TaxID=442709 RepID=A0A2A9ED18_9MICO|nr:iron chelate uptake ABC transporter family permease subunit [Flavimobilis soli]PFG36947.1 iron complex transport system permease protein [Flavimobilis soli]